MGRSLTALGANSGAQVTLPVTTQVPVVEAVFPLAGKTLPRDYAQALKHALVERLPWLEEDAAAGIHPLK
ncbi:MAG: hypothetical protein KAX88_03840, partial [Rhodoferax sp.]|nr:hypothetical protein [Rhodoferax sp.]